MVDRISFGTPHSVDLDDDKEEEEEGLSQPEFSEPPQDNGDLLESSSSPNFNDLLAPRSPMAKVSNLSIDSAVNISTGSTAVETASKTLQTLGATVPGELLGKVTNFTQAVLPSVPFASAILSGAVGLRTTHTKHIVEDRLDVTKRLLAQYSDGKPLELPESKRGTPLRDLLEDPTGECTATEALMHVLQFNIEKLESRITKLGIEQTGSVVTTIGAALTGAGALGAGIGALLGAIVSGVGGAISAAPTIHAAGRAIYKEMQEIKGVDRGSATQFLWGLALRKGIQDKVWPKESLGPKAQKALEMAEDWALLNKDDDMENAQNIATELLHGIEVLPSNQNPKNKKMALSQKEFLSSKGYKTIMKRLKSTTRT